MAEVGLLESLDTLQKIIGEANEAKGFHDEGNRLREQLASDHGTRQDYESARAALRNYEMAKVMLGVTELAEMAEELRSGWRLDEVYYSGPNANEEANRNLYEPLDAGGNPRKPEGPGPEAADVVIRLFDLFSEAGVSLGAEILRKLAYNETRSHMHGGKKI